VKIIVERSHRNFSLVKKEIFEEKKNVLNGEVKLMNHNHGTLMVLSRSNQYEMN
jgi:hypothetical protein